MKPFDFTYSCPGYQFVPSMSVVDVLMWNTPVAIKNHLDALKSVADLREIGNR